MIFYARNSRGFTLIEILVAVAIIGVLAAVVFANVSEGRKKVRDAQRKSDLQNIQLALRLYKDANGAYPDCASGMQISPGQGTPSGCSVNVVTAIAPYITKIPEDPLGSGYGVSYVYDSSADCISDNKTHTLLYVRQTEQAGTANWSAVCGTTQGNSPQRDTFISPNGARPNSTTYGIILK